MKERSESQETQHLQQVPWEQGSGRVQESLTPHWTHRILLGAGLFTPRLTYDRTILRGN